jgi:hypothetical protein
MKLATKKFTFKILLIGSVFLFPLYMFSQESMNSIDYKGIFAPDHTKIHYAGSKGFMSASAGWNFLNKHLETDIYAGFLPGSSGFDHHLSLSLEESYIPGKIKINNIEFIPIYGGVFLNYVFGHEYWTDLPEIYPEDYYWWASSFRFNLFVANRISFKLPNSQIDQIGINFIVNTNDLYIVSSLENETISLSDIIKLSFGIYIKY